MELWLAGGNTGLWHGVKGVNRSGAFKVLQGRALGLGRARIASNVSRGEWAVPCTSPLWEFCMMDLLWVLLAHALDEPCAGHILGLNEHPALFSLLQVGGRKRKPSDWSWVPCLPVVSSMVYILGSLCLRGSSSWLISEYGRVNGHFRVLWAKFCSQMQVLYSHWICKSFRKAAFDPVQDL